MTLLAVNHHYVAESAPPEPRAIFPTTLAQLERELELLGRSFEFVSKGDLVAAVRGERSLPGQGCAITFDDGLRAQFELALPLLERLGVPATFFVPALPLAEARVLGVHKIHALRERLEPAAFLARLGGELVDDDGRAAGMYTYDTPEAARIKYLLNVALPLTERDRLVDGIFAAEVGDEAPFAEELYMSAEQVAALGEAVGAHGNAHRPLARLDRGAVRAELAASVETLQGITGTHPAVISYPYGSVDAVNPAVGEQAAEAGFTAGFTMEPALNATLEQPLLLARIDVNDAPGGSHARLETLPVRARYLAEAAR